jgi:hypothetical protein
LAGLVELVRQGKSANLAFCHETLASVHRTAFDPVSPVTEILNSPSQKRQRLSAKIADPLPVHRLRLVGGHNILNYLVENNSDVRPDAIHACFVIKSAPIPLKNSTPDSIPR